MSKKKIKIFINYYYYCLFKKYNLIQLKFIILISELMIVVYKNKFFCLIINLSYKI